VIRTLRTRRISGPDQIDRNFLFHCYSDPDFEKLSAFATILAVKTICVELRREYDELPAQRHEIGGFGGGPITVSLDLTPPVDWLGAAPPEDADDVDDEGDHE
jgi:hypothetical protein